MPVVVFQPSGTTTISSTSDTGPNSHLCLAVFVLCCINPFFGLFAVIFSCSARCIAPVDWDGAQLRGKISMFLSITGIVTSVIAALVLIMIFYTRDT